MLWSRDRVDSHSWRGYAEVNILVARERPLSYNLLIGIDAIRALGGVTITPARDVKLGGGKQACAALCVKEPDFKAAFDHTKRMWTAKWKWTLKDVPTLLRNKVAEYKIPDNIRGEYEKEIANVDHERVVDPIPPGTTRTS